MARGKHGQAVIGTSEARNRLFALVREVAGHDEPAEKLTDHAVEIKTRGMDRSAFLVPAVDVETNQARIAELEEDLEDAGVALLITERLEASSGKRLTAAEFLKGIGMEEFMDGLPES